MFATSREIDQFVSRLKKIAVLDMKKEFSQGELGWAAVIKVQIDKEEVLRNSYPKTTEQWIARTRLMNELKKEVVDGLKKSEKTSNYLPAMFCNKE